MFVAINQMKHSGKKRKKAEEEKQGESEPGTNEDIEGKENNLIIMPTGMTDLLNGEQQLQWRSKEHLANAPLLSCCATLTTLDSPPRPAHASNDSATKAMANEPAVIKMTSKNCQCNCEKDQQHSKGCKHQVHHQHHQQLCDNLHHHHHHLQEQNSSSASSCKCLLHPSVNNSSNSSSSSSSPFSTLPNKTRVITSLTTVYLCLGILALGLSTLSVLFYSHASAIPVTCQNLTSSSLFSPVPLSGGDMGELYEKFPNDISSSSSLFRERFRQELLSSEHMLESMVQRIMQEQTLDLVAKGQRQPIQQQQQHKQQQQQQQLLPNEKHVSLGNDNDQSLFATTPPLSGTKFAVQNNEEDSNISTSSQAKVSSQQNAVLVSVALDGDDNNKEEGGDFLETAEEKLTRHTRGLRKHNGHSDITKEPETIEGFLQHPKRMRRDISSSPSTSMHDPFIEFFAPSHRKVLEEQDKEIRKRTGLKGAAPGGDEWVYLNTYCRVPEKIITGFCQSTQEYCPASPQGPEGPMGPKGPNGPPGLPGIPGPKGNRGDVGLPGPPGVDGAVGPMGPKGPKGDIGIPGRQGLDGRDGVPGEPGLDGVPGRAGADGIPGKDGIPGRDGKDGLNGKDGRDGAQGPKGSQGPPGERGLKGISGPRGRVGKPGTDGTPGIPGVNAYKVQLKNGTFLNELLIPPSIADVGKPHIRRPIIVNELKSLNLSCGATGNPPPHIEWRREDGRTINVNGVEMSSVSGPSLMIKQITRHHMAAYTCYADNGLAPTANATYLVEVHFQPLVRSLQTMIYAQYGRSATFECEVEAFPEAIRYWERASDGKILDPGDKYRIETYSDGYKTRMIMTVTQLRKDDFGYYYCVARNELNVTNLGFEIFPQDPNSVMPTLTKSERVEGRMPIEPECAVCEECPDTSLYQCKDSINYNFVTQETANGTYGGLPRRRKNCLLYAVGKPVFHKQHMNKLYVAWLRDPLSKMNDQEKTYTTTDDSSDILYEYATKRAYRLGDLPAEYRIPRGFQGNAHVVYNGCFYYHIRNSSYVGKYDLATKDTKNVSLPGAFGTGNKLYSTDYNYMDFNVDEVGLWIIYSTNDSNNTLVAKINSSDLKVEYSLNITLNHRKFGEMFIVCGHLYAIDSCTDKNSQIRYAVDLYTSKLLHVNLPFTNPFTRTTTVGYNPHTVELYSFDKGNALTYPIRYNDIIERGDQQLT